MSTSKALVAVYAQFLLHTYRNHAVQAVNHLSTWSLYSRTIQSTTCFNFSRRSCQSDIYTSRCRKRKRITKRKDDEDSGSEFSLSEEGAADDGSDRPASDDSASFETDSELSDDPLGEYDDADDAMYEQRRHKYTRGQCHAHKHEEVCRTLQHPL